MLHTVKLKAITVSFMWVYNNKAFALQNIDYYRFIQPNHQKNTGNVCLYVYVCIYDITLDFHW